MKNFGLHRVLEPAGSLPVTAWKLDNSPELHDGEIKIGLHSLVFERENFYQLCSICEYDDDAIRERICKIIRKIYKFKKILNFISCKRMRPYYTFRKNSCKSLIVNAADIGAGASRSSFGHECRGV